MPPRFKAGMLLIAIVQVLHSLEEFHGSLWEVFWPARLASSFVSDRPAFGFVVINTVIVALAFWTAVVPVAHNWTSARLLLWFWIVLELGNGIGHLALAISTRGYFPGVYTAPLLIVVSCYIGFKLLQEHDGPAG